MAFLVYAKNVRVGADVLFENSKFNFIGGRNISVVPALYDSKYNYVTPVNRWFLEISENLKDLSSYSRALLRYWSFLDENHLEWDEFKMPKNYKPTYRWRNELKREADSGEIAYSTANSYVCCMVAFYKSALSSGQLCIDNENAPFKCEWLKIVRGELSDSRNSVLHVQTTDLRIRVPKNAENNKVRSLNPLEREEIRAVIQVMLKEAPLEIRLMVGLGFQSGLRISEIATFSDKLVRMPLFGEKRIEVEIGPYVGVKTKFGKTRKVEIPAQLMRALYNYSVSERRSKRLSETGDFGKHIPLFINQRRKPYKIKSIMKLWGDIRKSVRIKYCLPFQHDFHDTRVSYCTYRLQAMLDSDVKPSDAISLLMGWMGHKNERTTWDYITFLRTREVRKEAMTMLDILMDEALTGGHEYRQ